MDGKIRLKQKNTKHENWVSLIITNRVHWCPTKLAIFQDICGGGPSFWGTPVKWKHEEQEHRETVNTGRLGKSLAMAHLFNSWLMSTSSFKIFNHDPFNNQNLALGIKRSSAKPHPSTPFMEFALDFSNTWVQTW